MKKHVSFIFTCTAILLVVGIVAVSLLVNGSTPVAAQPVETPAPFLNPIYYGQESVWQIFDHEFPLFRPTDDEYDNVRHYDGTVYLAVTITPDPNASPTPEGGATPAPYIPTAGYGYDQHIGIDYSLQYEPVLAAAEGTISFAGWFDPTNHQSSYGLHVRMVATDNQDYKMWYGHLSTLSVQTDDVITASYEDRNRILGISDNTGRGFSSSGSCDGIPIHGPNCGQHLHFEVRLIANGSNKPVNPYGWVGEETDPWSVYGDNEGATSHNLWINPPAINTEQYPSGTPIAAPPFNDDYFIEVDDSDPEFFTTHGDCWTDMGAFHQADVELVDITDLPAPNCYAEWSFDPTLFSPAGEYDVYARIPSEGTALHSSYTIQHNRQLNEAIVVQAAYPNDTGIEWAYLGRYEFGLNGSPIHYAQHNGYYGKWKDYIRISNQTITDTASIGTVAVADAVRLHPVHPWPDIELSSSININDAGGPNQKGETQLCESENSSEKEIYFGHCGNPQIITDTISGFRFDDVPVPKGAVVTAARLEFTVDGTYANTLNLQISGENATDPPAFDDSLPSTRTSLKLPTVSWSLDETEAWVMGTAEVSPDIGSIVQTIVTQEDWAEGNAMVFIIKPTDSSTAARRVFAWERYDGNPLQTAKLQIWLATPPPAPSGLTAVYHDGSIGPLGTGDDVIGIGIKPNPEGYVRLSWLGSGYPSGTTFWVYRSRTGTPVPLNSSIASGLSGTSYWDDYGQLGDWYVVTAKNENGESEPSAPVQAQPPCPEC